VLAQLAAMAVRTIAVRVHAGALLVHPRADGGIRTLSHGAAGVHLGTAGGVLPVQRGAPARGLRAPNGHLGTALGVLPAHAGLGAAGRDLSAVLGILSADAGATSRDLRPPRRVQAVDAPGVDPGAAGGTRALQPVLAHLAPGTLVHVRPAGAGVRAGLGGLGTGLCGVLVGFGAGPIRVLAGFGAGTVRVLAGLGAGAFGVLAGAGGVLPGLGAGAVFGAGGGRRHLRGQRGGRGRQRQGNDPVGLHQIGLHSEGTAGACGDHGASAPSAAQIDSTALGCPMFAIRSIP
jgi:hypothetical protein